MSDENRKPNCSNWRRGDRKVVIHYHVFKNAGTSLDESLREMFGPAWLAFDIGTEALRPCDAAHFLKDRPEIGALSSHLLRPPGPDGFDVFPIALVRHPLDRAYSCYCHSRRSDPVFESMQIARQTHFPSYVRWCLDNAKKGGLVIVNYQTIRFSLATFRNGTVLDAEASEEDLEEAYAMTRSLPTAGVVDRFDDYFDRLLNGLTTLLPWH